MHNSDHYGAYLLCSIIKILKLNSNGIYMSLAIRDEDILLLNIILSSMDKTSAICLPGIEKSYNLCII